MIYAISGIRDIHPSDASIVELEITEILSTVNDVEALIFGGARGVDTIALAAACMARGKCSTPKLIVIVPSRVENQPHEAREYICECADEVIELQLPVGKASSYYERNLAMLEHADALIAFWDGASGGTCNAIDAAHKRGMPVDIYGVRRARRSVGMAEVQAQRFPHRSESPTVGDCTINMPVVVFDRYVSMQAGGSPDTWLIHAMKTYQAHVTAVENLAARVAEGIAPLLQPVNVIVPVPRKAPGMESDLALFVQHLARLFNVCDGTSLLKRVRVPTGGVMRARRIRHTAEEHAQSMLVDDGHPVLRFLDQLHVLLVDNVTTFGSTLEGARRAIVRDLSGLDSLQGAVILAGGPYADAVTSGII